MVAAIVRVVGLAPIEGVVNVVGFLSRMFVPHGVRRAMHPARTVKSALTPKSVKRTRRALHPVSNATYSLKRSLTTKGRRRTPPPVYRHGVCPVKHRSADAAARCKR